MPKEEPLNRLLWENFNLFYKTLALFKTICVVSTLAVVNKKKSKAQVVSGVVDISDNASMDINTKKDHAQRFIECLKVSDMIFM